MPNIPAQNWPKAYLLEIHSEAVKHGYVYIQPITEADSIGLRQRLYRLRRRSDTSAKTFIPPEYHLVTVGEWELGPGGEGRLPVTYNRLPDGLQLPSITPVAAAESADDLQITEIEVVVPGAQLLPDPSLKPAFEPPSPDAIQMDPEDISDFVSRMKKKVEGGDVNS